MSESIPADQGSVDYDLYMLGFKAEERAEIIKIGNTMLAGGLGTGPESLGTAIMHWRSEEAHKAWWRGLPWYTRLWYSILTPIGMAIYRAEYAGRRWLQARDRNLYCLYRRTHWPWLLRLSTRIDDYLRGPVTATSD